MFNLWFWSAGAKKSSVRPEPLEQNVCFPGKKKTNADHLEGTSITEWNSSGKYFLRVSTRCCGPERAQAASHTGESHASGPGFEGRGDQLMLGPVKGHRCRVANV